MSDEDITGGLDLLGDWLDAKGYTEEAGLCTRAMDEINRLRSIISKDPNVVMIAYESGDHQKLGRGIGKLRDENMLLRQAMHDIYEVYAGSEGFIPETCPEAYLQDRIKEMAYIAGKHKRAAMGESDD